MEIIVGKNAGFCYGVQRAVEGAEEILKENKKQVFCLGEIVHNKDVIEELENKGIKFIENIKDAESIVIIRAHGVQANIYVEAKEKCLEIKDFTCPKVLKIHEIAEKYSEKGYYIILTGSKKHPENIGTISFCGKNHVILETQEELNQAIEEFKKSGLKKLLLISQTTYSVEKFEKIKCELQEKLSADVDFIVKNTICAATKIRQEETLNLAQKVNCMIIIGGKNSSNTKKLYEIAKKYCENSVCIENEKEIDLKQFKNYNKIGVMAGASTPQKSIEKVIKKLKSFE